jgi:hypothetical protein
MGIATLMMQQHQQGYSKILHRNKESISSIIVISPWPLKV